MEIYYVWQRDLRLMRRMINSFTMTILGSLISLAIFAPTITRMLPGMSVGTSIVSYLQFYVPGSLILAAFSASFYSGGSIQHDRREGMLQVMAASALARRSLALGKITSGATRAMIIAIGVFLVVTAAGFRFIHPITGALGLLGMAALTSWCFGAISACLAFSVRHRFGYDLLITGLSAPLSYLAAITYPETVLPGYLQFLARLNPLTYAANGVRETVIYGTFPSVFNLLVPLALAVVMTILAVRVAQNLSGDQLWAP
jgi:ABC-2 type transport system permease protein